MEQYGYARISTKDQKVDRQIEQLHSVGIDDRHIFVDRDGRDHFIRKKYNLLVGTPDTVPLLRKGDLLVVSSIDRLGGNYDEMKNQWQLITHEIGADIQVLDMPLLDTRQVDNSLDRRFIADLVFQILSYVAEKELITIRKRQKEGIEAARKNGVQLGRPAIGYPENWNTIYQQWKSEEITAVRAMQVLGLKRGTFYNYVKKYQKEEGE